MNTTSINMNSRTASISFLKIKPNQTINHVFSKTSKTNTAFNVNPKTVPVISKHVFNVNPETVIVISTTCVVLTITCFAILINETINGHYNTKQKTM